MKPNFYQLVKRTGLLLLIGALCSGYALSGQEPVTFSWNFGTLPNGSLVGSSSNANGSAGNAAYGPGISTVGTSPSGFLSGTSGLAIAG